MRSYSVDVFNHKQVDYMTQKFFAPLQESIKRKCQNNNSFYFLKLHMQITQMHRFVTLATSENPGVISLDDFPVTKSVLFDMN